MPYGGIMLVKDAKAIARQWVIEEASAAPGFAGAFYAGSTNWLPDDALLPPSSDLDLWVVYADHTPANKLGKFIYQDVLLEVSYISLDQLQSAELILSDYHMAGSFRVPSVILDPSGQLTKLQAVVSRDYPRRHWVVRRCEDARDK